MRTHLYRGSVQTLCGRWVAALAGPGDVSPSRMTTNYDRATCRSCLRVAYGLAVARVRIIEWRIVELAGLDAAIRLRGAA